MWGARSRAWGGKAQLAALRAVAGDLKLAYAQFEELETFARFGARLDDETQKSIVYGERIRACLKQAERAPVPVQAQIVIVLALTAHLLDAVAPARMDDAQGALVAAAQGMATDLLARLHGAGKLDAADREAIVALARKALLPWLPPADGQAAAAPAKAAPDAAVAGGA